MTEWQWQVILALIRIVLRVQTFKLHEDEQLLHEALAREVEYRKEYPLESK